MRASNPGTTKKHSLRHQLAKRVRYMRERRDWSQADLAKMSGLHRTHVSLIERQCCSLSLDNLERLAAAFASNASNGVRLD